MYIFRFNDCHIIDLISKANLELFRVINAENEQSLWGFTLIK